jgi:hypothetical protein
MDEILKPSARFSSGIRSAVRVLNPVEKSAKGNPIRKRKIPNPVKPIGRSKQKLINEPVNKAMMRVHLLPKRSIRYPVNGRNKKVDRVIKLEIKPTWTALPFNCLTIYKERMEPVILTVENASAFTSNTRMKSRVQSLLEEIEFLFIAGSMKCYPVR